MQPQKVKKRGSATCGNGIERAEQWKFKVGLHFPVFACREEGLLETEVDKNNRSVLRTGVVVIRYGISYVTPHDTVVLSRSGWWR